MIRLGAPKLAANLPERLDLPYLIISELSVYYTFISRYPRYKAVASNSVNSVHHLKMKLYCPIRISTSCDVTYLIILEFHVIMLRTACGPRNGHSRCCSEICGSRHSLTAFYSWASPERKPCSVTEVLHVSVSEYLLKSISQFHPEDRPLSKFVWQGIS